MAEPVRRAALLQRLEEGLEVDLVVIGGGATGLGVALDAAVRGLSVLLLEAGDFAQGTSSRATKLVHGGVRYLAQGDIALVREALHERTALLANAPHLAQRLPFIVPGYRVWEPGWDGGGLKAYATLAGSRSLGDTRLLSRSRTLELLPGVKAEGLVGGVRYWDGQFDDARLAVLLARTAAARGALVLNHARVTGLLQEAGQTCGVHVQPAEWAAPQGGAAAPGRSAVVRARCVVNAAGVWVDALRQMDAAGGAMAQQPMVAPSQGVHLVVDRRFLPGGHALMVPRTEDGRVLFAVPWLGKTVLGTTDTPRPDVVAEPRPFREEVDFILREAARYLRQAPQRSDVRSAWVGLRPLVKPVGGAADTKRVSREHTVVVSNSGLVTVTGGKWTTYRAMAEDVLERCILAGRLPRRPTGMTERLALLGAAAGQPLSAPPGLHLYGSEAAAVQALPGADHVLWRDAETGQAALLESMVRFAVREEMALSVEDILARRCRVLFVDAQAAEDLADPVAAILADECRRQGWPFDAEASAASFKALARSYRQLP
ncbi:MAG: FAD-dependent oxidoreductase [Rubrivivax sp.]